MIKIKIITPLGLYKEGEVGGVHVRTVEGETRILADAIEGREEIDIERARHAKQRAEERLKKMDNRTSIKRAEVALAKAINRIKVYGG